MAEEQEKEGAAEEEGRRRKERDCWKPLQIRNLNGCFLAHFSQPGPHTNRQVLQVVLLNLAESETGPASPLSVPVSGSGEGSARVGPEAGVASLTRTGGAVFQLCFR
jgi:hypothetical protein